MSRTVPLTGTNARRLRIAALGLLLADELHTTTDQKRVFLENVPIAPVWHPDAATEAAMLALATTSSRGCWPADMCVRTDLPALCICRSGHGAAPSDWQIVPLSSASTGGTSAATSYDPRDGWLLT